jgi:hypothetical protein
LKFSRHRVYLNKPTEGRGSETRRARSEVYD